MSAKFGDRSKSTGGNMLENPKGTRQHRTLSLPKDVHRVWCGGYWEVTLERRTARSSCQGFWNPLKDFEQERHLVLSLF